MGRRLNPGVEFETCYFKWFGHLSTVNLPAVHKSVHNLSHRRSKDKASQVASLLRAVTCLDLTTLSGDDTCSNVHRLCCKAVNPIKKEILLRLGIQPKEITCAAVCVYPTKVTECVQILRSLKSSVPVAAVAAGFPSGQYHRTSKQDEIRNCIEDGAKEIDIVISRDLVLCGKWKELYEEIRMLRASCCDAKLKTIIAAGELGSLTNVYRASMIAMAAGTDFIKTSTGKETVNATLAIGTVMARAVKDYYLETGYKVGFKPAGGIRRSKDVLLWQELMAKELGTEWLQPELFRIGASGLLGEIEKDLIQIVTGSYGRPSIPYL